MKQLKQMGIQMQFQVDGHVHLTHSPDSVCIDHFKILGVLFITGEI